MGKDLVRQDGVDVTVYGDFSTGELDTIRATIAKDCNQQQFALFMKTAAAMGLNPFLGHIHPVVYNGSLSIQVSVEGYDFKAKQHPDYIGCDVQTVNENDDFEAEQVELEGQQFFKIVTHKVQFPRGQVVGGYAIAKRKGRPDCVVLMEVSEVEHLKNGSNQLWKKFFNDMFKKHMKKRAIKGQFEIDFDEDEPLAQSPIDVTPAYNAAGNNRTIDVTPNTSSGAQISPTRMVQTGDDTFETPEQILENKREEVRQKMELAFMDKRQLDEFAMDHIGTLPKDMDARQLVALSRLLDQEIKQLEAAGTSHQASLLDNLPDELR